MKIGGDYVRIVDADALWKEFCRSEAIEERYGSGVLEIAGSIIDNAQTIDAVPIVRCKDCKYGKVDDSDFPTQYLCEYRGSDWNNGDHFCSYGEREDNVSNSR